MVRHASLAYLLPLQKLRTLGKRGCIVGTLHIAIVKLYLPLLLTTFTTLSLLRRTFT